MPIDSQINGWLYQFTQHYRRKRAASWMLHLLFASLVMLILCTISDRYFAFGTTRRWIAFGLIISPIVGLILLALGSLIPWPYSLLKVSRHAERKYPELEGRLSTWISQKQYPAHQQGNPELIALLGQQIDQITRQTSWTRIRGRAITGRHLWQMTASMLILGGLLFIPDFGLPQLSARLLSPWKSIKPVTTTQIRVVTGSVNVKQGASMAIVADVIKPGEAVYLVMSSSTAESTHIEMQPTSNERFAITLPNVLRDADYYIRSGDARSEQFHIGIEN